MSTSCTGNSTHPTSSPSGNKRIARTIIYLVNSRTEHQVRFSSMLLTQQFLSILAISTALAFLFVVLFEAPIVHLEKLMFGAAGVNRKPNKTSKKVTPS